MLEQPNREDAGVGRDLGRQALAICTLGAIGAAVLGAVADLYRSRSEAMHLAYQVQIALIEVFYVAALTAALGAVLIGIPWTVLDWVRTLPAGRT